MLIKVKVFPCSKKEEIIKKTDSFEIKIKEKPEMGKANNRVKDILSSYFKTSKNKIHIVKGAKKQNKIFKINL